MQTASHPDYKLSGYGYDWDLSGRKNRSKIHARRRAAKKAAKRDAQRQDARDAVQESSDGR